ncbi:MAG: DUF2062 domain-containing protein [Planctomycetales bacterium]|nr:DUF2062 domain-containing protein [Planctomycetales bacterium]MCA9225438.1 DUF2062 domain-containing protein [Planctomycetales bacterium]
MSAPAPGMIQRYTIERVRRAWHWAHHFVMHNMLHADDPPHQLALGVAIGVFVTFTPTVGAQMLLAVFLAWLLRANKVVGVPIVWISNPATIVPIFWTCYYVGRRLLGQPGIGREWWSELAHPPQGWWVAVKFYWSRLMEIAAPLWLGGCLVGLALGAVAYWSVYYLLCWYRMRRWGQLVPPDDFDSSGDSQHEAAA